MPSRWTSLLMLFLLVVGCNAMFGVDDLRFDGHGGATTAGGHAGSGAGQGGAAGATTSGTDGGGLHDLTGFAYRRLLTITSSTVLVEDYSLSFQLDHQQLVDHGKARADGDDVLVVEAVSGELRIIDRVVDPQSGWLSATTRIWFRAQTPSGGGSGGPYYVYYGNPSPQHVPPAEPSAVFDVYDDFDTLDSAWSLTAIGAPTTAQTALADGHLRLTSNGQNIFSDGDDCAFYHRSHSGNFVAETHISGAGGAHGAWGALGVLMIRNDQTASSRNFTIGPRWAAATVSSTWRLADSTYTGAASITSGTNLPSTMRITRLGDTVHGEYRNGNGWQSMATETFADALGPSVRVGLAHASDDANLVGWADIDWFLLRKYVEPEPVVATADEEPLRTP